MDSTMTVTTKSSKFVALILSRDGIYSEKMTSKD